MAKDMVRFFVSSTFRSLVSLSLCADELQALTCIPRNCGKDISPYKQVYLSLTAELCQVHENCQCFADGDYLPLVFQKPRFSLGNLGCPWCKSGCFLLLTSSHKYQKLRLIKSMLFLYYRGNCEKNTAQNKGQVAHF